MISYTASHIHNDELLKVETLAEPVSQLDLLILSSVFLSALCDETVASSRWESLVDQLRALGLLVPVCN